MAETNRQPACRCGAPALIGGAFTACIVLPLAGYFTATLLQPPSTGDLSEEAVARRIQPQAQVHLAIDGGTAKARTPEQVYRATCAACHETAVAGAPKRGDAAAWAPRLKAGTDGLVASAIKGKGAMPPKGGDTSIADAEMKAVVEYLTAGAK